MKKKEKEKKERKFSSGMHKVRTATQHLVEQPLSAISKIVNLYGFVSLSHHYGGIFTTLLQFTEV